MQAFRAWLFGKHRIALGWSLAVILLSSAGVAAFLLSLSPLPWDTFRQVIAWGDYLVPLLNWLPVLLLMALVFFLTSNLVAAVSSVTLLMVAMGLVNQTKLAMRGDPLLHWDLSLVGEVAGVVGGFGWGIAAIAGAAVLYVVASVFLGLYVNSRRMGLRLRVVCAVACAAVMAIVNATVYSSSAIEKSLPTWGSFYNAADVHASKGNLYEFIYTWNASRGAGPEGYDALAAQAYAEAYAQTCAPAEPAETLPHIIMIMGEAYSGISESAAVDFAGYTDPLAQFKAMGEAGVSGHLVVPGRGGGTADTEFDVLTALPTRYLRNAPYAYRMIVGDVEALPSHLRAMGYDTLALHPGYRWFYNRQNVYRHLGFDRAIFEDAFAPEAYRDTYISEEATFDRLLSEIDAHMQADTGAPLFAFCLTIQNHAAYENRFLPAGTDTFTPTVPMDDASRNILSNYFYGIAEADAQLARLADYLDALSEPAVVVYYGDHLPALSMALYDVLLPGADAAEGSRLKETRLYTVPFMIWQNAAAREAGILGEAPAEGLPPDRCISSNYLGAYLLELLGLDSLSPYYQYANEMRRAFPILMESRAFTPDGSDAALADEPLRTQLQQFRYWVHYRATSH